MILVINHWHKYHEPSTVASRNGTLEKALEHQQTRCMSPYTKQVCHGIQSTLSVDRMKPKIAMVWSDKGDKTTHPWESRDNKAMTYWYNVQSTGGSPNLMESTLSCVDSTTGGDLLVEPWHNWLQSVSHGHRQKTRDFETGSKSS